jgi:hypothetical protein
MTTLILTAHDCKKGKSKSLRNLEFANFFFRPLFHLLTRIIVLVVAALDKYIIGQNDAKRAVANALRKLSMNVNSI